MSENVELLFTGVKVVVGVALTAIVSVVGMWFRQVHSKVFGNHEIEIAEIKLQLELEKEQREKREDRNREHFKILHGDIKEILGRLPRNDD